MKIVKVQVTCRSCGTEWLTRGKAHDNCPRCGVSATTGWTRALEKRILSKRAR